MTLNDGGLNDVVVNDVDVNDIDEAKRIARKQARAARVSIPVDERARLSEIICSHIEAFDRWISASVFTAFLAIQSEVDLRALLTGPSVAGKTVGIPRTTDDRMSFDAVDLSDPSTLTVGEFNIAVARVPAPIPPDTVALCLVPLLAFDALGSRLGAGRAFYDRWLAMSPNAFRLGVAFSTQEHEFVPVEQHDVKLHAVVTENGIRFFS